MKLATYAALLATAVTVASAQILASPAQETSPAEDVANFAAPLEYFGKRSLNVPAERTTRLSKRHYGVWTCTSSSYQNWCRQFCSQEGVNGNCGCTGTSCWVGCGTGYARTDDQSAICKSIYADDVNNCGSAGNVCPSGTGVRSSSCQNGSCQVVCSNGFTLTQGQCLNLNSDMNNCGSAGTTCPTGTGIRSSTCSSGRCVVTCSSGYTLSQGQCMNLSTDVNNCGSAGNTCASGTGVRSSTCSGGKCIVSCSSGFTLTDGQCLNLSSDVNNCGSAGNTCASGTGVRSSTCSSGKCVVTCSSSFTLTSSQQCVNLQTDPENCGTAGRSCNGDGVASSTCSKGTCSVTCSSGFSQSSDKASCTSICKDGSTWNGSSCTRYTCGSDSDCTKNSGPNSRCYQGSCFTQSSNTSGKREGSQCGRTSGTFGDDNECAAGLVCVNYYCYNASNPQACGANQVRCTAPANASPACALTTCTWSCNAGYQLSSNGQSCTLSPSAKVRAKRGSNKKTSLCPTDETACPIAGSASFEAFVNSSDRVKDFAHSSGGFECINTQEDVESCGGCSSTGAGKDCTKMAHAADVGCQDGTCVLFSCKRGWVPSLAQDSCIHSESTNTQRLAHMRQRALRRKDISH